MPAKGSEIVQWALDLKKKYEQEQYELTLLSENASEDQEEKVIVRKVVQFESENTVLRETLESLYVDEEYNQTFALTTVNESENSTDPSSTVVYNDAQEEKKPNLSSKTREKLDVILSQMWGGDDGNDTFLTEFWRTETAHKSSEDLTISLPESQKSEAQTSLESVADVQNQNVPEDLKFIRRPLPPKVKLKEIIENVVERCNGNEPLSKVLRSESHQLLVQDGFWYFFIDEFCTSNNGALASIFDRMSCTYVKLFLSVRTDQKDLALEVYFDSLAQCLYYSFTAQYTESLKHFNENFKRKILKKTAEWTLGLIPKNPFCISHWKEDTYVPSAEEKAFKKHKLLKTNPLRMSDTIPVNFRKEQLRLHNSGFISRYFEFHRMSAVATKYHVKLSTTQPNALMVDSKEIDKEENAKLIKDLYKKTESERKKLAVLNRNFTEFKQEENERRKDVVKEFEIEEFQKNQSWKTSAEAVIKDLLEK